MSLGTGPRRTLGAVITPARALKRGATADDSNLMPVILDASREWAIMCGMCGTLCDVWASGASGPCPSPPDLVRTTL